ncbi:peptidoglycan bridge formation glycyltransferase FemA/FemB family protein [Candidatus Desantisbacteria bacterium]|nr:peptidoglycan bridge formation glycyltransferase FemA/FemB family protein [Candidatus Desantisbacteria bacterium]
MSEYKFIEIKEKNIWDSFIENTGNPQILQTYAWGEIKRNFSWEPLRFGFYQDDKLKGAVLLLKKIIPFSGGKSIFYAPRGPILDYHDSSILNGLLEGVRQINKYHKAIVLKIDPFISEDDEESKKKFLQCGFIKAEQEIQPRCTFIVDLEMSIDEISKNFEPKTRYNIKLAVEKGVIIKKTDGEEGVSIFYTLLQETAKRDKFVIHSEEYYKTVWNLLKNDKRCEIFLAYVDNKVVAGVFLFIFNNTCWYMYGASNNLYRNYMPNQLLHWEVISWAQSLGIKNYDLWGIPCNLYPEHPLWGVYRFKKGFGGKQVKLIGSYDLPLSGFYYFLWKKGLDIYRKAINLKTRKSLNSALEE